MVGNPEVILGTELSNGRFGSRRLLSRQVSSEVKSRARRGAVSVPFHSRPPQVCGDLAQAPALRLQFQNPFAVHRTLRTAQLLAIRLSRAWSKKVSRRL